MKTLRLEEYLEDDAPAYAILSHTWGEDSEELSFHDFNNNPFGAVELERSRRLGLAKLHGSCRQAKIDGIGHVWIDSCCIDRTNSVELSEAINSMFRWYSQAQVCYAYLADVPSSSNSHIRSSRWFERGWTLQELLAPERMKFYDERWNLLGTKGALSASISKVTGIPRRYLLGLTALRDASVAQRMSWAANRRTKRPEDVAYCLLGIFDVSMPMVYGEGRRHAFFRLQEQIIRKIRDDSILAWGLAPPGSRDAAPDTGSLTNVGHGNVLADHPSDFVSCGTIIKGRQQNGLTYALEISGDGVRANLALDEQPSGDVSAVLCCYPESDNRLAVSVPLAPTVDNAPGIPPHEFVRPRGRHATLVKKQSSPLLSRSIYIRNEETRQSTTQDGRQPFWFLIEGDDSAFDNIEVEPSSSWHVDRSLLSMAVLENDASILIRFCSREAGVPDLVVKVVLASEGSILQPRCFAMRSSRELALAKIANSLTAVPGDRMQPQVPIGNSLYAASIISAGEATVQNLFILDLRVTRSLSSASARYLDMDEELLKCLARVRGGALESGDQTRKPTRRRFVKLPCPGQLCDSTMPREWLCSTCHSYLEHGVTDDYFYCDCGRSHYQNFDFKCTSSPHGPEFQPYEAKVLDKLPKSLDSSNYTNILILGERGVGKSTLINAFVNYLAYSTFDEAIAAESLDWVIPTFFHAKSKPEDDPEGRLATNTGIKVGSEGEDERWDLGNDFTTTSGTQKTLVHVFAIGNRVLRLFDTPGIREDPVDGTMANILQTLGNYDSVHGILILVKSITFRLASPFRYHLKEILSNLPRSTAPKIAFGFTNARPTGYGARGGNSFSRIEKLLAEFEVAGLSLEHDTTYTFDSESFRYLAALKEGVKSGNVDDCRRSWDHSRREMWRLIDRCTTTQPHGPIHMAHWQVLLRQRDQLQERATKTAKFLRKTQVSLRKQIAVEPDTMQTLAEDTARLEAALRKWNREVVGAAARLKIFVQKNATMRLDDDTIDNMMKGVPNRYSSKTNTLTLELARAMKGLESVNMERLDEERIAHLLGGSQNYRRAILDLSDYWDPLDIPDGGVYSERPHKVHNGSGYVLPPGWVASSTSEGDGDSEMQG